MTKAHILKNFFKKYFNYDASGNSPIQVLNDVMENVDDIGGGGSGGSDEFVVTFTRTWSDDADDYIYECDKTEDEIWANYLENGGPCKMVAVLLDHYTDPEEIIRVGRCDSVGISISNHGIDGGKFFAGISARFPIFSVIAESELWFLDLTMNAGGTFDVVDTGFSLTKLT